MLKSWDTFSIISLINLFCYRSVCMTWPTPKRMSDMKYNIVTILMVVTSLGSFFNVRKNRYVFLEGEIHMLSRLSYPSSPIISVNLRKVVSHNGQESFSPIIQHVSNVYLEFIKEYD